MPDLKKLPKIITAKSSFLPSIFLSFCLFLSLCPFSTPSSLIFIPFFLLFLPFAPPLLKSFPICFEIITPPPLRGEYGTLKNPEIYKTCFKHRFRIALSSDVLDMFWNLFLNPFCKKRWVWIRKLFWCLKCVWIYCFGRRGGGGGISEYFHFVSFKKKKVK